jgi:hypothetical protein
MIKRKFLLFILICFYSGRAFSQYNVKAYLIGIWQSDGQKNAFSPSKYWFKDTINLSINYLNEKRTLSMHFTIDTVDKEQILSIINQDIEEMSRGFRTYKLRIINKDKITLKPYTLISFNENSGKVEEKDVSQGTEIHLTRISKQNKG